LDRNAQIARYEQRLQDGYELIERRREAGEDVSKLEDFWSVLLQEYEALLEAEPPALEVTKIKGRRPRPCSGCRQPILWRITPAGERMPLDMATTTEEGRGVYILEGDDHCKPYDPLFSGVGAPRHMNHWATCPQAHQFKRRSPRPAD
jgi:hypothetical protein